MSSSGEGEESKHGIRPRKGLFFTADHGGFGPGMHLLGVVSVGRCLKGGPTRPGPWPHGSVPPLPEPLLGSRCPHGQTASSLGTPAGLVRPQQAPAGSPGHRSGAVAGLRMVTVTLPKWGTGPDKEECAWGQQNRLSKLDGGSLSPPWAPEQRAVPHLLPCLPPGTGAAGQPGALAVPSTPDGSLTGRPTRPL